MTIPVQIPEFVDLKHFTDVQRATIFLIMLHSFLIFVGVVTRILINELNPSHSDDEKEIRST